MRKKIGLVILLTIFSAIIIGGIIAIPKKKSLYIDSNDIVCIQIKRTNKIVNITNRDEIDKIVDIFNSIRYKKKHPYIKVIDIWAGKDNDSISSNSYRIALFNEEQEHYFFEDGFQRIIVSGNNSSSEMKINSKDYKFLNIDEVEYKDYFKELMEKYSKE